MIDKTLVDQATKLGVVGLKIQAPNILKPPPNLTKTIVIQFDDVADGTVVDHVYASSGVNFASLTTQPPSTGHVYARRMQLATGASGMNVMSLSTHPGWGGAFFDARNGAIEATFDQLQSSVSVMALPMIFIEALGSDDNRPFMEAFDTNGTYLGRARTRLSPDDKGFDMVWQPLAFVSTSANIKKVRLSSQAHGSRWVYTVFDNLTFRVNLLLQRFP